MKIFEPDHPLVLNGTYDVEGYKPGERRRIAKAEARRLAEQQRCTHAFNSDGFCPKCGLVMLKSLLDLPDAARAQVANVLAEIDHHVAQSKGRPTMFPEDTPMLLKKVTFTTEVVDEETRRVVVCSFGIAPFTAAHAADLNVKSLVFDGQGLPKPALEAVVLRVDVPIQQLTFAMAPDQEDRRVVLRAVAIDPQVRVKIKQDREPAVVEATVKVNFVYPTADELLYIANGVNDTHYLTFEPEQGDLLTSADETETPRRRKKDSAGEQLRPGVYSEH